MGGGSDEGDVLTEGMMSRYTEYVKTYYEQKDREKTAYDTPLITFSLCRNPYLSLHLCSKCESVITKS